MQFIKLSGKKTLMSAIISFVAGAWLLYTLKLKLSPLAGFIQ